MQNTIKLWSVHMHKTRSIIFLICIIVLIDSIFFFPLFYPRNRTFTTPEFGGGDSITVQIPYRFFQCNKLKESKLPFWSRAMSSGYPLLAEGEIGAFNPLNLFACIFSDPQLVFNIQIILHTIVFQIGLLLLANKFKLKKISAIYVSVLVPFTPLFVMNYLQATLLFPFVYIPYLLYLYLEFIEKQKMGTYILFTFFVVLQFSTSHYQSFFVSSFALFIFVFVYVWTHNRKQINKLLLFFIVAYLFALGIAGFQTIPGWEFFLQSNRNSDILGSFGVKFSQTFTIQNFLTLFSPFMVGDPKIGNYPFATAAHPWEGTLYIYIIPLLCFIAQVVRKHGKTNPKYGVATFITLVFMIFMVMGNNSPIYFIQSIPPFSSFRFPTRFTFMIIFILCFYSTYGFDYLVSLIKTKRARLLLSFFIIGLIFLEAIWFTYRFHTLQDVSSVIKKTKHVNSVDNGKIYIPHIDSMLFNKYYAEQGYDKGNSNRYLEFILSSNKSNWNIIKGVTNYNTEIGPQLARYPYFINEIIERNSYNFETKTASFSGLARAIITRGAVTDIISSFSYPSSADFIRLEHTVKLPSSIPLYYYRVISPHKRVHVLDRFVLVSTYMDVLTNLLQNRNEVILEDKSITLTSSSAKLTSSAVITRETDEKINISVVSNKEAFLVIADSYYPGWHAYINGVETPILRANFIHRAIKIPKGKSDVVFSYIPQSFYYGCILSIGSLAGFALFLHFIKRNFFSIKK